MTQLARFQNRINEAIPLTQALGARLEAYNGDELLVSAPLAPNRNHQGTGFGGSVYSIAVVASWGILELLLADSRLAGSVVIQSGDMDYIEPVDQDFYALSRLPTGDEMTRFRKSLARYGKGRLTIPARVYTGEPTMDPSSEPVAAFQGRFVVKDARSLG